MSGHSKWSTIKRQKGATDAKRSANFTKLGNAITIASREGGDDASSNFKLRLAVDKARAANMPNDNIDRAIKRGTGDLVGQAFEQLTYEAYAPGGVALMIEVATDNKNRAVSDIKAVLHKYNAKLAEAGSVAYLFASKGSMMVSGKPIEELEIMVIESGADDYDSINDEILVYTRPKNLTLVAKSLEASGATVTDAQISLEPLSGVAIDDPKTAETLQSLVEKLEDLDDVTSVSANFDIDPSLA